MVVLAKVLGCSIPDLYRRRDTGNVIISDIFVMKRTEMLAQTLAMESGDLSKLISTQAISLTRPTPRPCEQSRTSLTLSASKSGPSIS